MKEIRPIGEAGLIKVLKPETAEIKPQAKPAAPPQDQAVLSSKARSRRYILQSEDPDKLKAIEKLLRNSPELCQIKKKLSLIGGIAVEFKPNANSLIKELKNMGADLIQDRKISIPEPPRKFSNREIGILLDVATKSLNLDKLWDQGITGKGVTIAVIDTGIAPHPDLKDRIIGFKDLVNNKKTAYDDQGHGTHVSGIAAGSGQASEGKYIGAAPQASLVGVKVLDKNGSGTYSDVIAGIQWAITNREKYNIKVINLSLGGEATQSYKEDPVAQAVEKAVESGIHVAVAAGNSGPDKETIGTPAIAPNVITVGALDDRGTIARDDDKIASFSSRGPTKHDKLNKPDIIAPGVKITAPNYSDDNYVSHSGTSMATPMTAGSIALIVQAKPDLSPKQLKELLMKTADPLANLDANTQGRGVIDPVEVVSMLESKV